MLPNCSATEAISLSLSCTIIIYEHHILDCIQNSFQSVTCNSQNGEPDFEGNFIFLVFSVSMQKVRLRNCLITEDNRGRM